MHLLTQWMRKTMNRKKLFIGPGRYLIIPTKWVDYPLDNCPICIENIKNKVNQYTGSNDPEVYAMPHGYFEKIEVPIGHWYSLGKKPKDLGPCNAEQFLKALKKAVKENAA